MGDPNVPKIHANMQLVFHDDFSDTQSGWEVSEKEEHKFNYSEGKYIMQAKNEDVVVWSMAPFTPIGADGIIKTTTRHTGGSVENFFGVICRRNSTEEYYAFIITSDGYGGILKSEKDNVVGLTGDEMDYVDAIYPGQNTIEAKCVGNELTMIVNDEQVFQVSDNTYPDGRYGVLVGSYVDEGTSISFDEITVWQNE